MNLNLEKNIKAAVEINGTSFITSENSYLYQHMDEKDIFLFIKSDDGKEIKIKISKEESIQIKDEAQP